MNKRRTKAEWQRLIDEQAASGLSRKAFCEGSGIALSTFAYWKRKLRTERDGGPTQHPEGATGVSLADWIELSTHGPASGGGWQIELDLGNGICLRLSRE
ncbi:MAG TPA: IS66 family insertion sequence hypothetical protein [Thiotrichales bacterium]|nr:IS66 family insertion sequence hypothetical protein [Thiotrichales bacterium]